MISAFLQAAATDLLALENGDQEGGGLAGAGLGLGGNVLAGQGDGQGLFLDRGQLGEAHVLDPPQQRGSSCNSSKVIVFFYLVSISLSGWEGCSGESNDKLYSVCFLQSPNLLMKNNSA